jgi:glycosyltransferase involved in cell wall biosynthesis
MLAGYYPPAFLAGGPTKSLPRIIDTLRDEFAFRVVTRDRDLGALTPLPGIVPDRWVETAGARCIYLAARGGLVPRLIRVLRGTPHDVLYLNSLFSIPFSLVPQLLRRFGLIPRRPLVIAPRGELDANALSLKASRKRIYLSLVHLLGLLKDAVWHAATDDEAAAIHRTFGRSARVLVARDISEPPGPPSPRPAKTPGSLDIVFLSRISPMKNLDFAIEVLRGVRGQVRFNIYGPIEDSAYWAACRRVADGLPGNVTVEYKGIAAPHEVAAIVAGHHLYFLPTRGESFGHAIAEALVAGCPVLISDRTPWRELESRHAGWDLPLSEPQRFAAAIERCVGMSAEELAVWSAGATALGREFAQDPTLDAAYRGLFRTAAIARPG